MDKVLAKMFEEAFKDKNLKLLQDLEDKMNITDDDPIDELEMICFKVGVKSALEFIKICEC